MKILKNENVLWNKKPMTEIAEEKILRISKERGGTALTTLFVTGYFLSFFSYCTIWLVSMKLPISFFVPFIVCISLSGTATGAFIYSRMIGRGVGLLKTTSAAGMLVFLAACVFNMKVPMQFLLFMADFPIEKPPLATLHALAELISISTIISVYCLLGYVFSGAFERVKNAASGYALHLGGFILGGFCAYLIVPVYGVYYALMAATMVVIHMYAGAFRIKLAATVVSIILLLYIHLAPESFFVFGLNDFQKIGSRWSSYTKIDYLSFNDDRCAAGLYNNFLMSYVCPDAQDDQFQRGKTFQVLAPGRNEVLVIGAATGMSMISLVAANPEITKGVGVEINPAIVEDTKSKLKKYGGDIYNRPGMKMVAADGRRFMDTDDSKYDMIFIDGIDNMQNFYLSSMVAVESYTFTEEGYGRIFNDRLKDDGIFLLNWGGTVISESYPFLLSLPDDVHYKMFWYVIAEAPFAGVPLFFMIASKNNEIIENYAQKLVLTSGMTPVEPPTNYNKNIHITDNHPTLYIMQIYMVLPLCVLAIGAYLMFLRKRFREATSISSPGLKLILLYFIFLGAAYAMLESFLIVKAGRFFSSPAVGVITLMSLFLAGNALANFLQSFGNRENARILKFDTMLLIMCCAGYTVTVLYLSLRGHDAATGMTATAVSGLLLGFYWPIGISCIKQQDRHMAFAMDGFGAVLGTLLFQVVFLLYGLLQTALLAAGTGFAAIIFFIVYAKRNFILR